MSCYRVSSSKRRIRPVSVRPCGHRSAFDDLSSRHGAATLCAAVGGVLGGTRLRHRGHRSTFDRPSPSYIDSSSDSSSSAAYPPRRKIPRSLWCGPGSYPYSDTSLCESSKSLDTLGDPWYEFIGLKDPSASEMNSPYVPAKGSAKNPISVTSSLDSGYPDQWKSVFRNSVPARHGSPLKHSRSTSMIGSAASRGSLSSDGSAASRSTVASALSHASAMALTAVAGNPSPQAKISRKSSIPEVLPGETIRSGMLVTTQSVRDGVDFDSYDFHESTQVHRMRCIPSECNRKLWQEARAKAETAELANSSERSSRKNSVDNGQFTYNGSVSSGHTSASSVTSNGSSGAGTSKQNHRKEHRGSSAHNIRE